MIPAGKLNETIKFFEYPVINDGTGGETNGPRTLVLETLANVRPVSSTRVLEAFQVGLENAYQITMRYRPDFVPSEDYELEYRGKKMAIRSVINTAEQRTDYRIIAAFKE